MLVHRHSWYIQGALFTLFLYFSVSAPRELLIYVLSVCVCVVLSFYHVFFWDQTQVVRVGSRLYDLLRNLAGPTGTFSSVHPGGAKAPHEPYGEKERMSKRHFSDLSCTGHGCRG